VRNRNVVTAVGAFFKSIERAGQRGLQDVLRLLTLWFQHGAVPDVSARARWPLPAARRAG
jgi:FKBP12-rapamycin complex-associated protein